MEKYNYDFIADQEPDGNSEWYPAKEVDEERECWKKEKEWLITHYITMRQSDGWVSDKKLREILLDSLQQAMKEG